ncbi:unnamed protein product [Prunus armeniaca]
MHSVKGPGRSFPSQAPGTGFGCPPSSGFFGRAGGLLGPSLGSPQKYSLRRFFSDLVLLPLNTPWEFPNGGVTRCPRRGHTRRQTLPPTPTPVPF